MLNSLVIDDSAYHAGYPDQWDKQRRGPRGPPEGILVNVNKSPWQVVQPYFDEVTHIELLAELVRAARAEYIE